MGFIFQGTLGSDTAVNTAALATETVPVQEPLSILDMALKGGLIMIPLLLLSVIAIYIFVERILAISKAGKEDKNFMNNIRDYILSGKIDSAKALCKSTDTPISHMIEKGVSRIGRPLDDISAAIENVAKLEIYKLESKLALLATISGAAPMIGFLGTVIGMIKSLYSMSAAGDNIVISTLAGGIYEAMVTTVGGLVVGIMAYVGYNLLVAQVEKVIHKMEARSIEFLDLLNEPG
ncbi:MAG: MotA/TolQ/ExbB proton channel family protein [Flavobacteriales bacterium]|nr:MotA/TolQ/ExbB proton channel family protein [Flavobacteriales bacterium]